MSLNDARELGRGSVRELGDLGRGRNEQAHDLAAQFVERGQRGKRLHAIDIQDGFAHRAAEDDELLVRLGEFDGNLRRRDRILGSSDHGRPLQKGTDGGDVSAFKSNFGETVLRDLHRCASLPHLRTQLLHLGDGEAGIVGHDGNVRGLEDLVERYDRVLFCRSFHSKLSPVGGRCPSWSRTTGLHPPSRPSPDSGTRSPGRHEGQDDILKPALPKPCGANGVSRFEPNSIHAARKGLARSKIRSSPVYAGHAIKPLKNLRSSRAPAVSDRIEVAGQADGPCPIPPRRRILFLSSEPMDRPERNFLLSFQHFGMRARTCQQQPARPEAAIYPLPYLLPRAKIGPLRMGRKDRKTGYSGTNIECSGKKGPKQPQTLFGRPVTGRPPGSSLGRRRLPCSD